jgi:hypothetical protein
MSTEYMICPHCKRVLGEYETKIGDHAPQAGDVAVCCHCGEVSIHVSPTMARLPTPFEAEELREDEAILDLRMEILLALAKGELA